MRSRRTERHRLRKGGNLRGKNMPLEVPEDMRSRRSFSQHLRDSSVGLASGNGDRDVVGPETSLTLGSFTVSLANSAASLRRLLSVLTMSPCLGWSTNR